MVSVGRHPSQLLSWKDCFCTTDSMMIRCRSYQRLIIILILLNVLKPKKNQTLTVFSDYCFYCSQSLGHDPLMGRMSETSGPWRSFSKVYLQLLLVFWNKIVAISTILKFIVKFQFLTHKLIFLFLGKTILPFLLFYPSQWF